MEMIAALTTALGRPVTSPRMTAMASPSDFLVLGRYRNGRSCAPTGKVFRKAPVPAPAGTAERPAPLAARTSRQQEPSWSPGSPGYLARSDSARASLCRRSCSLHGGWHLPLYAFSAGTARGQSAPDHHLRGHHERGLVAAGLLDGRSRDARQLHGRILAGGQRYVATVGRPGSGAPPSFAVPAMLSICSSSPLGSEAIFTSPRPRLGANS